MKLDIDLSKLIQCEGKATVLHKPDAVRLDGYPHLVYAPGQHGPGIRTEDNGTPVANIASAAAETPDYAALATRFGTTADHVADAIRYAVEAGFVAAETGE